MLSVNGMSQPAGGLVHISDIYVSIHIYPYLLQPCQNNLAASSPSFHPGACIFLAIHRVVFLAKALPSLSIRASVKVNGSCEKKRNRQINRHSSLHRKAQETALPIAFISLRSASCHAAYAFQPWTPKLYAFLYFLPRRHIGKRCFWNRYKGGRQYEGAFASRSSVLIQMLQKPKRIVPLFQFCGI